MNQKEWIQKIKRSCKKAGTYQPYFTDVIETLAQIMEARDQAHEQYKMSGAHPTIVHTNKAKERNVVKNPILVMENELNAQALAYWRDLGLTPKGLKALSADVVENKNSVGSLEKILEQLSG